MNYKKGITRIFIIGLFIAPLVGLFVDGKQMTNYRTSMWDTDDRMIANLKEPFCAGIVKQNPDVFPKTDPSYACSPLSIYWSTVKKYQAEEKLSGPVTEQIITDAMRESVNSSVSQMRWIIFATYEIGYLMACLFAAILFSILRWIYRGFKTQ